ncbi:ankyrin-3-like [Haliotis rubra]|uniref:ankyrin-3-like n=1 Tax=Haliotis rubra TaxID=36100 RepID=UPI001EE524DF|nr:ankyrin-3-like [Haliotis rubra]
MDSLKRKKKALRPKSVPKTKRSRPREKQGPNIENWIVQGARDHASAGSQHVSGITYNNDIKNYYTDNIFHATPEGLSESLSARDRRRAPNIEHHETSSRRDTIIQKHPNQMFNKACFEGNNNRVKQLISKGEVDINNVSPGGFTPVMIAVSKGHKQVFNTLLKEKCDLSLMLDNGDDILHVACSGSNADIVKGLVSNGEISLERKDLSGKTPLMKAACSGNRKAFDLLVDEQCNLTSIDYNGNTMLHAACSGGSVFIVNYLLNHKVAGLESRGEDGETPVMVAAKNGQKQVFDILVKKRCNLSVVDDLGDTVLHAACCSDSVDMVTNLLSKKMVDIESRGEDGLTPVMCAAMEGQTEVFNALVSQGV